MKHLFLLFFLIPNCTFAQNEKKETIVEKMPEYPGGEDSLIAYFQNNLQYPEKARKNEMTGRVLVSFTVCENGSLCDYQIRQSPDSSLSEEALRVVKAMQKWTPGTLDGKPVKVQYSLPIVFSLEETTRRDRREERKKKKAAGKKNEE